MWVGFKFNFKYLFELFVFSQSHTTYEVNYKPSNLLTACIVSYLVAILCLTGNLIQCCSYL